MYLMALQELYQVFTSSLLQAGGVVFETRNQVNQILPIKQITNNSALYSQFLFQLLLNQFSWFCHGDIYRTKTSVNEQVVSGAGWNVILFKKELLHLVCCTPPGWLEHFWRSQHLSTGRTGTLPHPSPPSGRWRCPLQTRLLWRDRWQDKHI